MKSWAVNQRSGAGGDGGVQRGSECCTVTTGVLNYDVFFGGFNWGISQNRMKEEVD